MAKHRVGQGRAGNPVLGLGGIDVAKDGHDVKWPDSNGRPVGKAFRFANISAGLEAMGDRRPSDAVRLGVKSTGPYCLVLAYPLRALCAD